MNDGLFGGYFQGHKIIGTQTMIMNGRVINQANAGCAIVAPMEATHALISAAHGYPLAQSDSFSTYYYAASGGSGVAACYRVPFAFTSSLRHIPVSNNGVYNQLNIGYNRVYGGANGADLDTSYSGLDVVGTQSIYLTSGNAWWASTGRQGYSGQAVYLTAGASATNGVSLAEDGKIVKLEVGGILASGAGSGALGDMVTSLGAYGKGGNVAAPWGVMRGGSTGFDISSNDVFPGEGASLFTHGETRSYTGGSFNQYVSNIPGYNILSSNQGGRDGWVVAEFINANDDGGYSLFGSFL